MEITRPGHSDPLPPTSAAFFRFELARCGSEASRSGPTTRLFHVKQRASWMKSPGPRPARSRIHIRLSASVGRTITSTDRRRGQHHEQQKAASQRHRQAPFDSGSASISLHAIDVVKAVGKGVGYGSAAVSLNGSKTTERRQARSHPRIQLDSPGSTDAAASHAPSSEQPISNDPRAIVFPPKARL